MKIVKVLWTLWLLGALVALALGSREMEEEEEGANRKVGPSRAKKDFQPISWRDRFNFRIKTKMAFREGKRHTWKSADLGEEDSISDRLGDQPPNLNYYACTSLNNTVGRCRPYQHCWKKEFYRSKNAFRKYVCAIPTEPVGIGLCCPTPAPVPKSTPQNESSTVADMECGKNMKAGTRIVGGTAATAREFPWMASLSSTEAYPMHFCGATLISPLHVITAAHCLDGNPPLESSWIRLGELDFKIEHESPYIERRVSKFLLHPDYKKATYENDIAILTLDTPVRFNNYIRPACLPSRPPEGDPEPFAGKMATVTGWGYLEFRGEKPTRLQKVSVPIMSHNVCKMYLGSRLYGKMMCAGYPEGGKDSCQNDSGGPLVVKEGKKSTLIGVVSWGIRCAMAKKPGVYTDVSKYLDWINENTSE